MEKPSSPRPTAPTGPRSPPTPEVSRKIAESRLRAKAHRNRREAEERSAGNPPAPRTTSGLIATDEIQLAGPQGRKRPYASISRAQIPETNRDARGATASKDGDAAGAAPAGSGSGKTWDPAPISRKFTKYVDYNFSAMTDTKGGFLAAEDDPFNKQMAGSVAAKPDAETKPAHMTAAEWERLQLIRNLKRNMAGPYEPGLSVLSDAKTTKKCRECGSVEIDFVWADVFKCCVCGRCKEKYPEKYSLLTKTECRDDYLITDPELRDPELLPHLSKPNPHKAHWHDMMLFLRYQVEEYAFNQKWGSAEALDAEFERRETDKKRRKEAKFKEKLMDLKRKTRTDAVRRNNARNGDGGGGRGGTAKFGDSVGGGGKHVHDWGRTVENAEGMTVKTCLSCGMEVEELEL